MIKIAIAVTQGHVQRAIDFYNKGGKFFVLGGTTPWTDETSPDTPSPADYQLLNTVGYKKVDNCYLVVPDASGTIAYRTQNWRIVSLPFRTSLTGAVNSGTNILTVDSPAGLSVGDKVRVGNIYEANITAVDINNNHITLNMNAPSNIPSGTILEAGALVEGAKYVYVDCYLNYDQFPIVTYRQIGLCSEVTPAASSTLLTAAYSTSGTDEFTSRGVLEILDNRPPNTRDIDQRELLSLIIEM